MAEEGREGSLGQRTGSEAGAASDAAARASVLSDSEKTFPWLSAVSATKQRNSATTILRQGKLLYRYNHKPYRLRFVVLENDVLKLLHVDDNLTPMWSDVDRELKIDVGTLLVQPAKSKFVLVLEGSKDQHSFKAEGETTFDNWTVDLAKILQPPPEGDSATSTPGQFKRKFFSKIRRGSQKPTQLSEALASVDAELLEDERRTRKQIVAVSSAVLQALDNILDLTAAKMDSKSSMFELSTKLVSDVGSACALVETLTGVSHDDVEIVTKTLYANTASLVFNLDSVTKRDGTARQDAQTRQDAATTAGVGVRQTLNALVKLSEPTDTDREGGASVARLSGISTDSAEHAPTTLGVDSIADDAPEETRPPRPPRDDAPPVRPPKPRRAPPPLPPDTDDERAEGESASEASRTDTAVDKSTASKRAMPVTMWPVHHAESLPDVDMMSSYESRKRAMTVMSPAQGHSTVKNVNNSSANQFQATMELGLSAVFRDIDKRPATPRVLAQKRRMTMTTALALMEDDEDGSAPQSGMTSMDDKTDSIGEAKNTESQGASPLRPSIVVSMEGGAEDDDEVTDLVPRRSSIRKTSIVSLGNATGLKMRSEEVEGKQIPRVLSGTCANLVTHLLSDENQDPDFLPTFLHCFEIFTTADALFDQLLQHHDSFMLLYKTEDESVTEAEVLRAHQRACYLLVQILRKRWESVDDQTLYQLDQVAFDLISTGRAEAAQQLRDQTKIRYGKCTAMEDEDEKSVHVVQNTNIDRPLASLTVTTQPVSLLDCSALDLAKTLCVLDFQYFVKIEQDEIMAWRKQQSHETSPNVYPMIDHFNKVSLWAASQILMHLTLSDRAKAYQKLVETCKCLRKLHNFNTLMAVLAALNSSPIHRLKFTHDTAGARCRAQLQRLNTLMSHEDSYATLRAALRTCRRPAVPYLGMYLTDITLAHMGNSDFINQGDVSSKDLIDDEDAVINFAKMRMLYGICQTIKMFQSENYGTLEVNQSIREYLGDFEHRSDEEQFEISLHLEPRDADIESIA